MNRIVFLLSAALAVTLHGCATSDDSVEARNIEVLHVVFSEIWSKGNVDLIDDVYAEDFVGHFPAGTVHGREGLLARVTAHRKAFPDWTEKVDDTIAEGDRVAMRFTSRGTNLGEFLGNPPTGNRVEISEVAIFRLRDGKVVEQWVYPNMLSMQRQLGKKEPSTLVGTWLITETTTTTSDSSWTNSNPQTGLYIFTETHFGNMLIQGSEPRQLFPESPTPEQRLAAYDPFIADAGSYELTDSTITTQNIIAKIPNVMTASGLVYRYKLSGDSLTLTFSGAWAPRGGDITYRLVRLRQDGR
jgi:steroid delta-isomerase-like uncharacterized protein